MSNYKYYPKNVKIFFLLFTVGYLNSFAQLITKGPYLAEPKNTSIIIRWESDLQEEYTVNYGSDENLIFTKNAEQIGNLENRFLYEAKIEKLISGKKYFYQIITNKFKSKIIEFKCNQLKKIPITFVVTGDSRSQPKIFTAISEKINQLNPDLVISMGDLVRNGGDYSQWDKHYFSIAKNIIDHIPFISTLGDHEGNPISGDNGELFKYFLFPNHDHKKLWYSYNYSDAHFVVLDYRHPNNKEMIDWFEDDMSNSDGEWNFVYMHRPSYNLGGHRSAWGRDIWPELFNKYKVDVVFAGHSHLYERFFPVKPKNSSSTHAVTYITTGGSGASLYKTGQSSIVAFAKSIHHYLVIKIEGKKLNLIAYKKDGSILEKISWTKGSDEFQSLTRVQDELDIVGLLFNTISKKVERLPMREMPAITRIKLNPIFCDEEVFYDIFLSEESKKYYEMETVSGISKPDKNFMLELKIYAKGNMTISKWGEIKPSIQIKANYRTNSFSGSIIVKDIEYLAY